MCPHGGKCDLNGLEYLQIWEIFHAAGMWKCHVFLMPFFAACTQSQRVLKHHPVLIKLEAPSVSIVLFYDLKKNCG